LDFLYGKFTEDFQALKAASQSVKEPVHSFIS